MLALNTILSYNNNLISLFKMTIETKPQSTTPHEEESGQIDGFRLYMRDIGNIPLQTEKHEEWGKAIFVGKIALLALSQLSQSALLSPSQKKIMQILQENKFLLRIAESTVISTRSRLESNTYKDGKRKKLDEEFKRLVNTSEEVVSQQINRAQTFEDETERKRLMQKFQRFIDKQIDYANQGKLAFDNLVVGNLRLSVQFAYHYLKQHGLPIEDLASYAGYGVMGAAARWDTRIGTQFSTYAVWWIRQALSRGIIDEGSLIRLPVNVSNQVNRYYREQVQSRDHPPSNKPLPDTLTRALGTQRIISLNQPLTIDSDTEFGEVIPDPVSDSIGNIVEGKYRREMVKKLLSKLPERERRVMELRFGIDDGRERTLEEVGRLFRVSRERIRQLEEKAKRKLRGWGRTGEFKEISDS